MDREIARRMAPLMRQLLEAVKHNYDEPTDYMTQEQMREAEEDVELLEELASSDPEPWEAP